MVRRQTEVAIVYTTKEFQQFYKKKSTDAPKQVSGVSEQV